MIVEKVLNKFGYVKELPPPDPKDRDTLVKEITSGIGYDMKWYRNWMDNYWNPNPVMRSNKFTGYHLFEEMDADAHIYNVFSTRKDALLSRPYNIRSAMPKNELEEVKRAFAQWNHDHIKAIIQKKRKVMSHLDYGFSVSEIIYGYEDVQLPDRVEVKNGVKTTIKGPLLRDALVINDLKTKVPSAFGFDGFGNLTMVPTPKSPELNRGAIGARVLKPEENLHFLVLTHDDRFGSRYGWPLKASIFWDYLMKKAGKIFRMIYVEKYGMPILKGQYPAGTKKEGQGGTDEFEKNLKGLQKNSYLMHPEGFVVEFVNAMEKAGTMDVFGLLMEFTDGNVSEVGLGHRHATTASSTSPFSTDTQQSLLRQDKLEMDAVDLDTALNDQFIDRIVDLNFTPNGFCPKGITDVEPEEDLNKAMYRIQAGYNMRIPQSLRQVREKMGWKEPEDADDTLLMEITEPGTVPISGDNPENAAVQEKLDRIYELLLNSRN